jgi:hypothetical protein
MKYCALCGTGAGAVCCGGTVKMRNTATYNIRNGNELKIFIEDFDPGGP